MPARGLEAASVTGLAIILTVLLTYPIAFRIDRVARFDSADGQWNVWNVAWVARTLVLAPRTVWDANIFFPHRNTLAYSENNFGAGVLAIPVYWGSGNPILAHNAVVLLSFVFAFLGMYYLARYLTGSRRAAIVPAIAFAFAPYLFAHMAHIQLLLTAGLPLSLLAVHRYVDRPAAGRAFAVALVLIVQMLSCGYYGLFAGLSVGLAVLFYAVSRSLWRKPHYWAGVAVAAIASVVPVATIFRPYFALQREQGFARTLDDATMYSAGLSDYLASAAWAHRWMLPHLSPWVDVLFPGFLPVGLAAAALALAARHSRPGFGETVPRMRETVAFYTLLAALAFWVSLGPPAGLYTALYHMLPAFSFLRGASRFGIFVTLSAAVLSGIALAHLQQRIETRRGTLLVGGLAVLLTAELTAIPLRQVEAAPVPQAYRFLATAPAGPVAEFPFFWERNVFHRHAYYMYYSAYHWQPLINGYSDHFPADFRRMVVPMSTFPSRHSFWLLRQRRAKYVVFHLNFYDARSRELLMERLELYQDYLEPLVQEDNVWLYEITGWPAWEPDS